MIVPVITEQCGEQKKGTVVPTVDAGTTQVKLVEVELSGALKSPLAVQLLPLQRASMQLVFEPARSITDTEFAVGFMNGESSRRAFRKAHGQTPGRFLKTHSGRPGKRVPS